MAKKIEDSWYVKSKIEVKEQTQPGNVVRRNSQYVQKGDFVDVRVVVYIQRTKGTIIRFGMEEIVILQKKSPVHQLMNHRSQKLILCLALLRVVEEPTSTAIRGRDGS